MALTLVTAPSASDPVITLPEAKMHCRAMEIDEDALLTSLVTAATSWAESYTRRAFVTQTWDLKLESFYDCDYYRDGAVWLPKAPVASITSITYVDSNGTTQTWSTDDW